MTAATVNGAPTAALPFRYEAGVTPDLWPGPHAGPVLWLVDSRSNRTWGPGCEAVLDARERARAAAYRREEHRRIYVAAHIALRMLLGAYLAQDPAAVRFVREDCPRCGGPHGRPAVAGSPVHFSLSHGEGVALLGFAGTPIGVDVEKPPAQDALSHLVPCLHKRERAELAALPAGERPSAFTACWARKEAYLKGLGIGLARGPHLDYVGAGGEAAALTDWTLTDVAAPDGFFAACAVRDENP